MTNLVSIPGGIYWPFGRNTIFASGTGATLNATASKFAGVGRLLLPARTGSKTLNTSGGSKIGFQTGTVTFANASSTLDIGIQGVNTSGPPAQPDGSFTIKTTVTTAANTSPNLASNTWCEATMSASGPVTLNHGDQLAVVFDLTNRAGADSIVFQPSSGITSAFPTTNAFASAAWNASGSGQIPNMVLTFSDGTLGILDGVTMYGNYSARTWADATNPDERGLIFQVPFDCKVDALSTHMRISDANCDFIIALYSTPEGTPAVMGGGTATITVDSAQLNQVSADGVGTFTLPSEVSLTANTDYCVAIRATGSSNVRWTEATLGAAGHRAFFPGGTTIRSVTRDGGSGAFGSSSTTLMHPLWVRLSQVPDGTGGGTSTAMVIGG